MPVPVLRSVISNSLNLRASSEHRGGELSGVVSLWRIHDSAPRACRSECHAVRCVYQLLLARGLLFSYSIRVLLCVHTVQRVLRPVEAPRVSCGVVAASCVAFYTLESVVLGIMFGYPYRMFCNGT